MYTYDDAMVKLAEMQQTGQDLQATAWNLSLLCVGWPYIFGDRGAKCTPSHRRAAYASKGADHPTIKSKCKNFNGTSACSGCQFYPGGVTLAFDCRGFTYWVLKKVYGWELKGAGCTSQWNTASNWKAKGRVADGIPANTLVCLFYSKNGLEKTWEHTGFGYNGETVECNSGVQHFTSMNKKWTHWAVPSCISGDIPEPVPPEPSSDKPTLKRGSKGEYVLILQTALKERGYDIGSYGIDGSFGRCTESAVKAFQTDHGLTADGIVGKKTWEALEIPSVELYTVSIPHLTGELADKLLAEYPGSSKVKERG